jgi:hypothetical protein
MQFQSKSSRTGILTHFQIDSGPRSSGLVIPSPFIIDDNEKTALCSKKARNSDLSEVPSSNLIHFDEGLLNFSLPDLVIAKL